MGHESLRAKLVLVALVAVLLAGLPSVALAATGSFSGKLLDRSTSLGIENGVASFYLVDINGDLNWAGDAISDASGDYYLGAVDPGDYVMEASNLAYTYEPRYYLDTIDPSAVTTITIGDGQDLTLSDMSLRPYAHVSGHVTRKLDGSSLASITIDAAEEIAPGVWISALQTTTDANGDYSLDYLLAGSYHLRFSDETSGAFTDAMYQDVFSYPDPADLSVGTTLTVTDGQLLSGIDQPMVDVALFPYESTAPTTTATVDPDLARTSWSTTGTALVSLEATDGATGSGVASIWYATSASGPRIAYAPGDTIPVTAEGTSTIYFGAIDRWNNAEATKTVSVHLDRSAPTVDASVVIDHGASMTFLTASDPYSGVSAILYRLDGAAETTYTGQIVTGLGDHAIVYRAIDNVGNASDPQTATLGVRVPATLSRPALSVRTPRHGKGFRVSGSLSPVDQNPTRVTLFIERKSGGRYRSYARVQVPLAAANNKYSAYVKLRRIGSYRIRAYHAGDSIRVAAYSTFRYFSVK